MASDQAAEVLQPSRLQRDLLELTQIVSELLGGTVDSYLFRSHNLHSEDILPPTALEKA